MPTRWGRRERRPLVQGHRGGRRAHALLARPFVVHPHTHADPPSHPYETRTQAHKPLQTKPLNRQKKRPNHQTKTSCRQVQGLLVLQPHRRGPAVPRPLPARRATGRAAAGRAGRPGGGRGGRGGATGRERPQGGGQARVLHGGGVCCMCVCVTVCVCVVLLCASACPCIGTQQQLARVPLDGKHASLNRACSSLAAAPPRCLPWMSRPTRSCWPGARTWWAVRSTTCTSRWGKGCARTRGREGGYVF